MIPGLRFVIGAVTASVLLGVTVFGLIAAVHISRQAKVGPLEASRLLAYTPDNARALQQAPIVAADHPLGQFPADPVPLRELPTRAADAQPLPSPASEAPAPAAAPLLPSRPVDDADKVDERAVVDPPLPADDGVPVSAADAAPAPPANVETATQSDSAQPLAPPVETAPAAPTVPAAVADQTVPPSVPPDSEPIGSIPTADAVSDPAAVVSAEAASSEAAPKASRSRRSARKAVAKAKLARRTPASIAPTASTGYPVTTTPAGGRPATGFWSD